MFSSRFIVCITLVLFTLNEKNKRPVQAFEVVTVIKEVLRTNYNAMLALCTIVWNGYPFMPCLRGVIQGGMLWCKNHPSLPLQMAVHIDIS